MSYEYRFYRLTTEMYSAFKQLDIHKGVELNKIRLALIDVMDMTIYRLHGYLGSC